MSDLYCNEFIARLPGLLRGKILAIAKVICLQEEQAFKLQGHYSNYVYFPETALISLSHVLTNSSFTEVMIIGKEGLLISPRQLEVRPNLVGLTLNNGTVLRVPLDALRTLAEENVLLQRALNAYADFTTEQLYQIIACYRHHSVKQQLSRWLLAYDDRFPHETISTTHAILAHRLGVRREAVSSVASQLQCVGALRYHRHQIEWINRSILTPYSCNCYDVLRTIEHKKAQRVTLGSGIYA